MGGGGGGVVDGLRRAGIRRGSTILRFQLCLGPGNNTESVFIWRL